MKLLMEDFTIVQSRRSAVAAMTKHGQPRSLQVAALCWRRNQRGKIRILLITSRDTGRWVIPKGWPMHNRSHAEAAEREAFEEAGVQGNLRHESLGLFTYRKQLGRGRSILCVVQVFALEVQTRLKKYPENGQRRSVWLSRKKAAREVREPELRTLIRKFNPDAR